jgi:hypothetical protein
MAARQAQFFFIGFLPGSLKGGSYHFAFKKVSICRGEPCVRPLAQGEYKIRPYEKNYTFEAFAKFISSLCVPYAPRGNNFSQRRKGRKERVKKLGVLCVFARNFFTAQMQEPENTQKKAFFKRLG